MVGWCSWLVGDGDECIACRRRHQQANAGSSSKQAAAAIADADDGDGAVVGVVADVAVNEWKTMETIFVFLIALVFFSAVWVQTNHFIPVLLRLSLCCDLPFVDRVSNHLHDLVM